MVRAVDVGCGGELVWHAGDQQRGQLSTTGAHRKPRGLNAIVMFFALLGGLQVFGVLGIVLGRVLFAIAASGWPTILTFHFAIMQVQSPEANMTVYWGVLNLFLG